ncbi:bifunctional epoxide hydrolase 2 [Mugil cephalus]|uniref:bifunctional epoxide hydrolase 2 n=1 Tax=Mugil cephalus TaxID=48193 RepID=UPI001FB7F380|nr:bifunctional epoxide hydrolase 2 [Mugil cephalus]
MNKSCSSRETSDSLRTNFKPMHSESEEMAERKVILFNFWGIVVPSRPDAVFDKFEEVHELPRGFLSSVASQKDGAMMQAERGSISLSQMIPALEADCAKEARVRGVTLPSDWSVKGLLEELRGAMADVQTAVLKTSSSLRGSGLLTAVLANHWVDDSADGDGPARLLCLLGGNFDLVLQSCRSGHRVPEAAMFSSALQRLGVTPQQAVWLDADEEGVKAAEGAGLKAILVENLDVALEKLAEFTGVQAVGAESPPPPCRLDQVSHGYVSISPGVRIHFVEMGCGPPVLLCHGFPDSWFTWRHQMPALAAAGFRAIAADMKGYGESTAPLDREEYSMEKIVKDLVTFLDRMSIPQVTLVGQDWGGNLVWTMAQTYPERVRAVASLNTPLVKGDPSVDIMERLKAVPFFDYQFYFRNRDVAAAELEKDLERTFNAVFNRNREEDGPVYDLIGVCDRGGLLVGLPEQIPPSPLLSKADMQYYISQYKERGFRRPLNWYGHLEENWKWMCTRPFDKLLKPALMVTSGRDRTLPPFLSMGMEEMAVNLTRGHLEECAHWTQKEKPAETNDILISWLKKTHKKSGDVAGDEM